ncbi:two-component system, NarL family, response regulator DesR [Micromonospora matsumotoense]|uniref:Two-component system, NarL family, response regulator DesR n=1 Tax=Micromonospora matsumotoense TaxID=121616 RepID=A0A1C4VW23_9ACTN|nr:response regulator transcription factor [Micromonospora matsumotoense]SCE88177.1 two-component system, NarL family, response regulator DesR [Micromonospora matsumotoense]
MVRTLLALQGGLLRGALAQLLSAEHDIEIVGEVDSPHHLRAAVRAERPDVAVIEFGMLPVAELIHLATADPAADFTADPAGDPYSSVTGADPVATDVAGGPHPRQLVAPPATLVGSLLVLVEQRRAGRLGPVLAEHGHRIGFLSRDVPPGRIVDGVRQLAGGRVVLDPDLVVAALEVAHSPLTNREREVLDVVAEGHPVQEIADRLVLSAGTVRNHLSRIMAKTGARTRWEAVRIARESGWL